MSEPRIDFSRAELEAICRRRAVKRLALFGSVLRDDSVSYTHLTLPTNREV